MERKVLVICVLVGFLGLLSAALAFAAEATRNKLSEDGTCTEQRTPAFGLGLISGLALVMAQIIINSAACCMFCKKRQLNSGCDRTKAMACFFGSWVTFVLGSVALFFGVALNEGHWEEEGSECYLVRPMVFIRAAVLSLASVILGIFYFIIISSAKNMEPGGTHQTQDIALAQPQFTPQNTQPVFIHEDTYNRLQVP
ncbi:hypothetical protein MRB53_019358 [Persea americana]|uniref:Uncharacterized protein n=1 Tax=Persea americana TaxID=3435 RepID=A0ACC2KXQ1_PERAE|nr:hypothetical protein MRB53_019358 [Persea americana]